MDRHNILGVEFTLLSYEEVAAKLDGWRERHERHYVTLSPPYSVLMCRRDPELRAATKRAALTLPDGIGIVLAAHLLRYPHRGRVSGPTLMLKLCDWGRASGLRHYFYGGRPGVANKLTERLTAALGGLEVAGTYCPPFRQLTNEEDEEVIQEINRCQPDLVWVGLGSPKQEKWMAEHLGRIDAAALIGVGAAFDFHSGQVPWAPAWIRSAGLEWAYRLAQEPRRLWWRNVNSFVFLTQVLQQCLVRSPQ